MLSKLTQFERRKAKAATVEVTPETVAVPAEFIEPAPAAPQAAPTPDYPLFAYDIFLAPDNRTYNIVTIKYDPVSKAAVVTEVKEIGRNIALSHDHSKRALTTLKDR